MDLLGRPIEGLKNSVYRLVLPYPPSANRSVRVGKGKFYKPGFIERFNWAVLAEATKRKTPKFPLEVRLHIEILLYPPNKQMQDIDNRVRQIYNSLQASGVVQNDYQFETMYVARKEVVKGGACEISLEVLSPAL